MDPPIIAHRLRQAREAIGLSQDDVAEFLGIKQSAYSQIERGQNAIKIEHLLKLPVILRRPVSWFLNLPGEDTLTPDEAELIALWRALPHDTLTRPHALEMMRSLVSLIAKKNNRL